jgi:hypothetical protein
MTSPPRDKTRSASLLDSVQIPQMLAGFEAHRLARGDDHFDAGLGVAADAALAVAHLEDAETAQLDALTAAEGGLHRVEDRLDGLRGERARDVRYLGYTVNEVSLDHFSRRSEAPSGEGPDRERRV